MASQSQRDTQSLDRLLDFLRHDSGNTALLADAALLAYDINQLEQSAGLLEQHAALKPLPANLQNLQALIALAQGRFEQATQAFEAVRAGGSDNPALRFNLAWSLAMQGQYQAALDYLDDTALIASPRAPALRIQILHHLGRLDEALEQGAAMLEHTQDPVMAGMLASVAIDAEQADMAANFGRLAGDNAEGQAALGMLAMRDQDLVSSRALFERALQLEPNNPRALLGKGLGLLSAGDHAAGAEAIDRGAELFQTHIGSSVTAGWSHFTAGNYPAARERFERALSIDSNFSESHGGLAVIHAIEGRTEEAQRECEIALRLDRNCFGAALAKSMLLRGQGEAGKAQRVIEMAMTMPAGPRGETLAQLLAGLGMRPLG